MSARTRSGVIGSSVTAPGICKASSTAEAMAAPAPLMPASPAPLAPSGLRGLGASSKISASTGGVSAAVGMR